MKSKISILLIFYNDAKYLEETIKSILNQTYQNFELIMLDNGSTDGSYNIAAQYENLNNQIKIIKSKQNYHNGSLNFRKLLEISTGKYIKLFCADDIMMPDCLKKQIKVLENNNYVACFAHMKSINDDSKLLPPKKNYYSVMKDNSY